MAFPVELTSVLTGASLSQLQNWRTSNLLVPEIAGRPRALYSFRDIVALRTVVHLRSQVSLQRVRSAFETLKELDLTNHPSTYTLVEREGSIALREGEFGTDLVKKKGQIFIVSLDDVFAPFENMQGAQVVDFRKPAPNIAVREQRLGGWPTVDGTRVGYSTVASLMRGEDAMSAEEVNYFYPTVSMQAAGDALAFDETVRSIRRSS